MCLGVSKILWYVNVYSFILQIFFAALVSDRLWSTHLNLTLLWRLRHTQWAILCSKSSWDEGGHNWDEKNVWPHSGSRYSKASSSRGQLRGSSGSHRLVIRRSRTSLKREAWSGAPVRSDCDKVKIRRRVSRYYVSSRQFRPRHRLRRR